MEESDFLRIACKESYSFEAFGVGIRVASNRPEAISSFKEILPGILPMGWQEHAGEDIISEFRLIWGEGDNPIDALFQDGEKIDIRLDAFRLIPLLQTFLRVTIAENAKGFVFMHAGVVGIDGRALIIPGHSYTGKSTLVAALLKCGADYLSDEYAVIDEDGIIHPFFKRLSLREDPLSRRQSSYSVEDIGGRKASGPMPPGMVLITEFEEGADWLPEELSPGFGVLEMLNHTISIRKSPEFALKVLNRVAKDAIFIRSKRGEAPDFAKLVFSFARIRREML